MNETERRMVEKKVKGVLFFDIDGTLVDSENRKQMPSEVTIETIHRCRQAGYKCFIASGRNLGNLTQFFDLPFDGIVFGDGGAIRIGEEVVHTNPIANHLVTELIYQIDQIHGSLRIAGIRKSYLMKEHLAFFMELAEIYGKQEGISAEERFKKFQNAPIEEWDGDEIIQIDVDFLSKDDEQEWLKEKNPELDYIYTGATFGAHKCAGEITAKGVSKATGCQWVMDHYGLDQSHAYAFGDSMNDKEMLLWAGTGICMDNGDPALKQISDYVTSSVSEEGIQKACEHFRLM